MIIYYLIISIYFFNFVFLHLFSSFFKKTKSEKECKSELLIIPPFPPFQTYILPPPRLPTTDHRPPFTTTTGTKYASVLPLPTTSFTKSVLPTTTFTTTTSVTKTVLPTTFTTFTATTSVTKTIPTTTTFTMSHNDDEDWPAGSWNEDGTFFKCLSGMEIPASQTFNDRIDCPTGEDERPGQPQVSSSTSTTTSTTSSTTAAVSTTSSTTAAVTTSTSTVSTTSEASMDFGSSKEERIELEKVMKTIRDNNNNFFAR